MGVEGLKALATECAADGALFPAAKAKLGLANLRQGELRMSATLLKEALALLEQMPARTGESYQLEVGSNACSSSLPRPKQHQLTLYAPTSGSFWRGIPGL